MNYANYANCSFCVICFICNIKKLLHPSYQYLVLFRSLLFRSIYIVKTKVTLSQLDISNKIKKHRLLRVGSNFVNNIELLL